MNLKPISLLGFFVLSLSLSIFSCDRYASRDYFRDADFNAQWQFQMGDISDPTNAGEDESEWIPVHLPHDWSIIDYELQDSLNEGPFFRDLPGGADVGYLRNGTAWYKKEFITPEDFPDKYREAVIKATDQCAVKRILKDPPEIEVRTVSV